MQKTSDRKTNIRSYASRNDNWKLVFWDDKSFLYVKNLPKFYDIINRFEYKYINQYNFYYLNNNIQKGLSEEYKNYRDVVKNEAKRKIFEPSGVVINDIAKYLNSLN